MGVEENNILGNSPDEFNKLYETLYKRHNRVLEKMRKKLKRIIGFGYVLIILWAISCFYISRPEVSVTIGITGLILFYLYYDKNESKYIEFYKKEIINSFFNSLNEKLIYVRSRNEITEIMQEYEVSRFNKLFDAFEANDFVEGYIDRDVFVKMCGLHVRIGAGKKSHRLRINSVFSFTVLNKYIRNQIKITTKHKLEKDAIEIGSEEFEKLFHIASTNKELVKNLLNSEVMNYLINFHNETKINFEIILKSNRLYLRFFRDGMFEPKVYGPSLNKALLIKDFRMLSFVVSLTRKINKSLKCIEM